MQTIQTKGNEFFYSVGRLMIPKEQVSDKIVDFIELFIDQIPLLTEQTKQHLIDSKPAPFIMDMRTISFILRQFYANWLATEADKLIRLAETNELSLCRKIIFPFITELLSLSIDLQIAQRNSIVLGKKSVIELYTDILNNLNAVESLISDKKYDESINIISHIDLLKENSIAKRLLKFAEDKNYENAVDEAKKLKDEYAELLSNLGLQSEGTSQKKKLLAVDDHSDILITIRGMLEPHLTVYAAAGGRTAIAIMEKHRPDIFLLDIEMPGIDGFELARTIRASAGHEKTPIIFLTSNATRKYVMEALHCGANDFIVKPASYNSLMVKISKFIQIGTDYTRSQTNLQSNGVSDGTGNFLEKSSL